MTINETLNYLLAKRTELLMQFSGQVTTASTYLKGSGGEAGDGWPAPRSGKIVGLQLWDGSVLHEAAGEVAYSAGDRLSVYADYSAPTFSVAVRVNGVNSTVVATGILPNATFFATVNLIME